MSSARGADFAALLLPLSSHRWYLYLLLLLYLWHRLQVLVGDLASRSADKSLAIVSTVMGKSPLVVTSQGNLLLCADPVAEGVILFYRNKTVSSLQMRMMTCAWPGPELGPARETARPH